MPLDPILVPLLVGYPEMPQVIDDYDAFRAATSQGTDALIAQVAEPGPEVARIDDVDIPVAGGTIVLRIYRPEVAGPLPIHLFFHGGGFVVGSVFDQVTDITCRERAALGDHIVVSVNYRKAPENAFPVPLDDAYAALLWAADNASAIGGRADRISVGGASAGGNLAAALALKARDLNGPSLVLQILEVPALDLSFSSPAHDLFGSGFALSTWDLEVSRRAYLADDNDYLSPYASPLHAPDLAGLPRAVILSAEFDILRDDGSAYAQRLEEAGVDAQFTLQEGQVHVSSALTAISPAARFWRTQIIDALRGVTDGE
ncbi:alpha/beta hydrolase [Naasia lichenicola]|uniref:Alpha/beta hydrolase n=1 Tax=Naasia lichenicola TaxID=2565933 RepID=A0A4V3WT11_9MICO|nr:alpha/beta hydrolase [Naasia lichenicola]THG30187.1 alpha/beta hydrolase [Naasia lichenicola]